MIIGIAQRVQHRPIMCQSVDKARPAVGAFRLGQQVIQALQRDLAAVRIPAHLRGLGEAIDLPCLHANPPRRRDDRRGRPDRAGRQSHPCLRSQPSFDHNGRQCSMMRSFNRPTISPESIVSAAASVCCFSHRVPWIISDTGRSRLIPRQRRSAIEPEPRGSAMTDHYDALETREPAKREADLFSRLPGRAAQGDGGAGLCRAPEGYRSGFGDQPGCAGAPAGAAQVGTPRPAQGRAAVRRVRGGVSGIVRAAVYLAGPDLRARACPCRPLARRAGAVRGGFPARRRGAQHLQLPSDTRRFHFRRLGAGAGLRGDSRRPWQYRAAVRADRSLPSDRL